MSTPEVRYTTYAIRYGLDGIEVWAWREDDTDRLKPNRIAVVTSLESARAVVPEGATPLPVPTGAIEVWQV